MTKKYVLKLYVAGDAQQTESLTQSLQKLLETHLKGFFELDVINILKNPELAIRDNVLATPTLLRVFPEPTKRVIGDLLNAELVLSALGIDEEKTSQLE